MRNEEFGKEGVSMTTYKSAFALADCNSDSSIVGRWGSVAKIMAERFRTEVRIVPCYAGKSFFAQSEHAPDFIYSLNHEWKLEYPYRYFCSELDVKWGPKLLVEFEVSAGMTFEWAEELLDAARMACGGYLACPALLSESNGRKGLPVAVEDLFVECCKRHSTWRYKRADFKITKIDYEQKRVSAVMYFDPWPIYEFCLQRMRLVEDVTKLIKAKDLREWLGGAIKKDSIWPRCFISPMMNVCGVRAENGVYFWSHEKDAFVNAGLGPLYDIFGGCEYKLFQLPYGYGHSASLDNTAIDSLSDYAQFIEINWRMKHVERTYKREDEFDRYECDPAECDPALNRPDYE